MESVVCMNGACASSISLERENGWPLRSGGFATLCHDCGNAYKALTFCEVFHSDDTGWRECNSCGKRLHCGCIASTSLLEILDAGGVKCKGCTNTSKFPSTEKSKSCGLGINQNIGQMASTQSGDGSENDYHNSDTAPALKLEENFPAPGEIEHKISTTLNQTPVETLKDFDVLQESIGGKYADESVVETNLCIGLPSGLISDQEREFCTPFSSFPQHCTPLHFLPRFPKPMRASGSLETNSKLRVARPPVEGRVKNQLLPRYWPRITDQELLQISGDSNSTIVPLFEKVLSASDAGRIGRLVLPKACAEAYFPPISQPEGLPLRIQDVKGKEWVFQFRFWPNNNSRMYVLEGVTPCIQSMQLQAGDTVTFSRMDPQGKLLMGFRKASNNFSMQQDSNLSTMTSGSSFPSEPLLVSSENLPIMSGLLQSIKGSRNSWGDNLVPPQSLVVLERKRNRNIGSKSKRLLIDGHDALVIKLSWEEVQDMLRPPPTMETNTTTVEDHEFEEFDEPPVFGKRTIFVVRLSGDQEQWVQCDRCCKLRKLALDFLVPKKWTCQDNVQDHPRSSCSAPEELGSKDLDNLLRMNKEFKKQRVPAHDPDASGFECESSSSLSVSAATTKHPRHRPGCSCIVCIQPPSGKGKHKPTCSCNVCMTVKRRFKTLMMRKKKRQAEMAHMNQMDDDAKEEGEIVERSSSIPPTPSSQVVSDNAKFDTELEFRCQGESPSQENPAICKGGELDLNCRPVVEHTTPSRVSMMSLLHEAGLPLDTYLRQNGLTRLVVSDQQTHKAQEDQQTGIIDQEKGERELSGKDYTENDPSG